MIYCQKMLDLCIYSKDPYAWVFMKFTPMERDHM